jgi:tetratricopeptide (TPR) repeat protein
MACKEVMVSAPLVVLLYDRTFCAGSFGQAWQRRKAVYLSLAGAWLLLGWLMAATGSRGGSVGPSVRQFTCWSYPLTEAAVILHYLRLSAWPTGLCLDYGWPPPQTLVAALVPAVIVAGLVGLTGWALLKRSAWGFVGAWFFLILAPTSSFVPVLDAAFEHRMYLPLAAVATGVVAAGWVVGREIAHRKIISLRTSRLIGGALVIFAGFALGILTSDRNRDYRSALAIWEDTAAKAPENGRAQYNLGMTLVACGRSDAAIASFAKAVELTPRHAEAHNGLGNVLFNSGQVAAAIEHYRAALEIRPDFAEAHNNLGLALAQEGLYDEAITHFQKAMALKPDFADACRNLLVALSKKGQAD